jgi:hypothetical protein
MVVVEESVKIFWMCLSLGRIFTGENSSAGLHVTSWREFQAVMNHAQDTGEARARK